MTKKQKLELTWIGKNDVIKLEPRILIEDTELSYHASKRHDDTDLFDNKLIFGDNLLALKALEQKYAGLIKCIYIDPPYNTGNAFEHYEDGLEHSIWLSLMKQRLEILWKLLSNDGFMAVQIDDNEFARLYILLGELFGERNLKVICVKMSEPSGLKMGTVKRLGTIPKLKEYIILCGKSGIKGLNIEKIPKQSWDSEYNIYIENITPKERDLISAFADAEEISEQNLQQLDLVASKFKLVSVADKLREYGISAADKEKWLFDNAWRICQCATSASVLVLAKEKRETNKNDVFFVKSVRGLLYMVRSGFSNESAKPRIQLIFADDNLTVHPGDLWTDIKTTGLDGEGGVDFKNGKKPEALVARIIKMCTQKNDIVLDSFGGSGTTGAVAHKLGRKWILIELGEHCHTHAIPRLKKVINGEDQGGVSEAAKWKGGGGFRYYKLAPSLLAKDKWDNWVINKEYDANMLAAAVCKHEGFTYSPSETEWWAHGYSTETDFIYVTTQTLTEEQLVALSEDVGNERTLLVCCSAFKASAAMLNDKLSNLTLKKMPHALLSKCEWGKDDYSLNVSKLPIAEHDDDEHDIAPKKKAAKKEADLFGEE